jgi:hypothetical protein
VNLGVSVTEHFADDSILLLMGTSAFQEVVERTYDIRFYFHPSASNHTARLATTSVLLSNSSYH